MKALHVKVHGRVQGVWFRASAQDQASRLGVYGWVRNTPDGGVEIHVQGADELVDSMVTWCHTGPPGARVTKVDIDPASPQEDLKRFAIKY